MLNLQIIGNTSLLSLSNKYFLKLSFSGHIQFALLSTAKNRYIGLEVKNMPLVLGAVASLYELLVVVDNVQIEIVVFVAFELGVVVFAAFELGVVVALFDSAFFGRRIVDFDAVVGAGKNSYQEFDFEYFD